MNAHPANPHRANPHRANPRPANGGSVDGAGTLVLAATPIGSLDDASPRLVRELAAADVIAAEDTRRLRRLCGELGVASRARVVSYFEGNEAQRTGELMGELRAGSRVVLVTDAGMPAVSDPGYRLVAAASAEGMTVTAVPGPSAVLMALTVSGLPVDRFCFEGFPSRKPGERRRRLEELAGETRTMVFFEAARRTEATLRAMSEAFGESRRAAVCRELTKTYEEVRRDRLDALVGWAQDGVLGEVTIVVAGAEAASPHRGPEEIADMVAAAEARGLSRKDAVLEVARTTGMPRRQVYDIAHRR